MQVRFSTAQRLLEAPEPLRRLRGLLRPCTLQRVSTGLQWGCLSACGPAPVQCVCVQTKARFKTARRHSSRLQPHSSRAYELPSISALCIHRHKHWRRTPVIQVSGIRLLRVGCVQASVRRPRRHSGSSDVCPGMKSTPWTHVRDTLHSAWTLDAAPGAQAKAAPPSGLRQPLFNNHLFGVHELSTKLWG